MSGIVIPSVPVVLIHFGASVCLPLAVTQAQRFGNTVHVLQDANSKTARRFAEHYVHLSGNHYAFELQCFMRWFVLRDWMRRTETNAAFYQDSDVLLFCNVTDEYETWGSPYALTLALGASPATSYFSRAGIEAFCDFVLDCYVNRTALFTELERIYAEMRAQNLAGGISDMALFQFFKAQVTHLRVGEMTEIHNGTTWDHNLNASDGYRTENGRKEIRMFGNTPYIFHEKRGGFVRFNALHFQGGAKEIMPRYAAAGELVEA